ncbi:MAG: hypothetical protein DKT66_20515 [Candidatus Melainabacteria bacterium]|nr:MAG: hypothetical protein DKT66_20515 [Candidatus Melainabacteria bacterium]
MSKTVTLMEALLKDPSVSVREHVVESASPHVSNVKQTFEGKFESLVSEIGKEWGHPIFNSTFDDPDNPKAVAPSWSVGNPKDGGEAKTLKLSYWKRDNIINYILLRTEVDPQKNNKPLYYEIVIGGKRRISEGNIKVDGLRQQKPTIWGTIRSWFVWG